MYLTGELLDLSPFSNEELQHFLAKRQIDLQVMGMNLVHNRQGELAKIDGETTSVLNSKVNELAEVAVELQRRKVPVHINIANQHPVIAKMIEANLQSKNLAQSQKLLKGPRTRGRSVRRRTK